ncbi:MAG: sigma factor-like helix-turn-helix DNA-binding protein [Actinomycetota bacterium]
MIEPNGRGRRLDNVEVQARAVPRGGPTVAGAAVPVAETASFDAFYSANYDSLVRALSVTLGDAAWGRDAADEAMTRAYERWTAVSAYANPAGWTYRVGVNWARSWHRKLARRLPWAADPQILGPTPDPELDAALADLDVKYRSVVVCRYLLDWSTVQTADALDLKVGTVKSRLSTGLDRLRAALEAPRHARNGDSP